MTLSSVVASDILVPHSQLYIAGDYVDAASGETTDVVSPVTGEVIASVAVPGREDLDRAVAAAREAQRAWSRVGVWQRAAILHKVGDLIAAKRDQLAHLLTLEQGKPLTESYADIDETAQLFHLHSEDAVRLHGETLPANDTHKRMWTFYQGVGTWAIVIPWNFPVLMFSEFAAPGLATGNALVVKPPTHTPLTLLATVEVLEEAGVPAGLVSILPGEGAFGADLVSHPGIDAIGFIGSSATAEKIVATAGLKRSIIEASGNGPVVVLDDADVEAAARAAVRGAYYNAGQVCCATGRVLVASAVRERFVEAARAAAQEAVLGDPFHAATTLGPMNNHATASKVDAHLPDRPLLRLHRRRRRRAGRAAERRRDLRARRPDHLGRHRRRAAPHRQRRCARPAGRRLHEGPQPRLPVRGADAHRAGDRERQQRVLGHQHALRRGRREPHGLGPHRREAHPARHERPAHRRDPPRLMQRIPTLLAIASIP
jgi:succinate-semialdehyde dehydrogenase/glutarate-semialdehyde dehydrogenase